MPTALKKNITASTPVLEFKTLFHPLLIFALNQSSSFFSFFRPNHHKPQCIGKLPNFAPFSISNMNLSIPRTAENAPSPWFAADLLTQCDHPLVRGVDNQVPTGCLLRLLILDGRDSTCEHWDSPTKLKDLAVMDGSNCVFLAKLESTFYDTQCPLMQTGSLLIVDSYEMVWLRTGANCFYGFAGFMLVKSFHVQSPPLFVYGEPNHHLSVKHLLLEQVHSNAAFIFLQEYWCTEEETCLGHMGARDFFQDFEFLPRDGSVDDDTNLNHELLNYLAKDATCDCQKVGGLGKCALKTIPVVTVNLESLCHQCTRLRGEEADVGHSWNSLSNKDKRRMLKYWYAINVFANHQYSNFIGGVPECVNRRLHEDTVLLSL